MDMRSVSPQRFGSSEEGLRIVLQGVALGEYRDLLLRTDATELQLIAEQLRHLLHQCFVSHAILPHRLLVIQELGFPIQNFAKKSRIAWLNTSGRSM